MFVTALVMWPECSFPPIHTAVMTDDILFVGYELLSQMRQNTSSVVWRRLNGKVFLAGHSIAGSLSAMATSRTWSEAHRRDVVTGVISIAPDTRGPVPTPASHLSGISVPLLVIVGEGDCLNGVGEARR